MPVKDRIRLWARVKFLPWVKKNKIPLIVIAICLIFITVTMIRRGRPPTKPKPDLPIETTEKGITGEDVKKELLAWNKENPYAFIITEKSDFAKGYDKEKDPYKIIYTSKGSKNTYLFGKNEEPLWGVNYGSVLADEVISREFGVDFCAINGLQRKTEKEKVIIGDTDKKKTIIIRKKNNPYTVESGIDIPDEEIFLRYVLNDLNGNEIGCVYITTEYSIDH